MAATIRQRWLGGDLKRLREDADLTVQDVAARIDVSDSTIQRIERAAFMPKERVLRSLLETYGADFTRSARLIDLWHQARRRSWWIGYGDEIVDGTYVDLEETARTIRSYQSQLVPGLLQTEEYASATLHAVRPGSKDHLQRLDFRVRRRLRFSEREDPPALHVILDEAVLRRPVGGPAVFRGQIRYLARVAEQPHVTIQVVPFDVGAYVGLAGSFVLLSFDSEDFPDVGYVESRGGDLYPEDETTLAGFNIDFARLIEVALSPEESVDFLTGLLKKE